MRIDEPATATSPEAGGGRLHDFEGVAEEARATRGRAREDEVRRRFSAHRRRIRQGRLLKATPEFQRATPPRA